MSACTVCQNAERLSIEADLRASEKPDWRALRQKYGLMHHLALISHKRMHMNMKPPALSQRAAVHSDIDPAEMTRELRDAPDMRSIKIPREPALVPLVFSSPHDIQVTQNPLRQFTHAIDTAAEAYELAHDDPQMQAHMRERLQKKIERMVRDDDMGVS